MKAQEVIMETDEFIAINKLPGVLSIPDREGKEVSLKTLLQEKYGRIFTVHRLDKETSGLILFAKTEAAHKHLSMQFEERHTKKIYLGLVLGRPAEKSGNIDAPIAEHPAKNGSMIIQRSGKEAQTRYEVLGCYGMYAWIQFRIFTGRTHQIRVHMKHIGHPIACDPLYGDGKPLFLSSFKHRFKLSGKDEEEKPMLRRLALHAFQLSFTDSWGKPLHLEAPLPKDLQATLRQLQKWAL